MEGQGDQNALQLTSLAFVGNASDASQLADDLNQQYIMSARRDGIHHVPLSFPQLIPGQQTGHNYLEFFAESGVSEIQREISYKNYGMAPASKPANSSFDINAQEVRYLRPHNEGAPVNTFTCPEHQKHESNEDHCDVSRPHSRVAVAEQGFPPKSRNIVSRQKATNADRRRRTRIAERLDALQELLPHSKERCKASLLDDVIDHIKLLQLQIKDLSRSRLGGESTSSPFISLEGYGHYILNEQMLNEPLEEMMGKLLEVNPSAATQLLESRGFFMMPMALTEGLHTI